MNPLPSPNGFQISICSKLSPLVKNISSLERKKKQWHVRVLGEFGGRPTTKMISTTQTSLSLFIFIPFLFTLHPLYLSFSRIPLENFGPSNFRDLDSLSTLPAPTIPPHANQPLGFKSGSSLINLRFRIYWVDRGWGELTILLIFFSHQVLSWHLFFLIFTG